MQGVICDRRQLQKCIRRFVLLSAVIAILVANALGIKLGYAPDMGLKNVLPYIRPPIIICAYLSVIFRLAIVPLEVEDQSHPNNSRLGQETRYSGLYGMAKSEA